MRTLGLLRFFLLQVRCTGVYIGVSVHGRRGSVCCMHKLGFFRSVRGVATVQWIGPVGHCTCPTNLPGCPTNLPRYPTNLPGCPTNLPRYPTNLPGYPTYLPQWQDMLFQRDSRDSVSAEFMSWYILLQYGKHMACAVHLYVIVGMGLMPCQPWLHHSFRFNM